MYKKPYIIAEAGCNHMGQMNIAKDLIETAAHFSKANAIKFQKRCPIELLTHEQYTAPHPNPENAFGNSYGSHREFLEFTIDQHEQLKKWCDQAGIVYASSVWDLTSAKEIASLHPDFIKIPSACNTNYEMLQWLCDHYTGEIQLSCGMTTYKEEEEIVRFFEENNRAKDLVLFNCTSGYPVPFRDVCLLEIKRMLNAYEHRVKAIGFSGHHLGIAIDIAAYTLGVYTIERHYTLDRTWKGTDHAASLEPDGVRKLVRNLYAVQEALQYKSSEILPIEQVQRNKLKYQQEKADH
jgi:N-acetylneuraminate synthase